MCSWKPRRDLTIWRTPVFFRSDWKPVTMNCHSHQEKCSKTLLFKSSRHKGTWPGLTFPWGIWGEVRGRQCSWQCLLNNFWNCLMDRQQQEDIGPYWFRDRFAGLWVGWGESWNPGGAGVVGGRTRGCPQDVADLVSLGYACKKWCEETWAFGWVAICRWVEWKCCYKLESLGAML